MPEGEQTLVKQWILWLSLMLGSWAQPPVELVPAPGEVVAEDRPCVQVSWPADSLTTGRCRLWWNGKEVTGDCLRNETFLSYRPFRAPDPGPVELKFSALARDGSLLEKSWKFEVQPVRLVGEVEHNGQGDLFAEDLLEVHFRARPRGKAQFRLPGLDPIPMQEKEPGNYQGSYRIRAGDRAMGVPIVVHYQLGDHREQAQSRQVVKIFGGFYRVRVISPPDGSSVEQNFVLSGRARPGSRVSIIPKIGFDSTQAAPTTNSAQVTGTAGSIPAEVDADGNFSVEYGVPLLLPGMELVISVYAVEEDGTRSIPTVVRYHFK